MSPLPVPRTAVILATYGEPTRNAFGDQWMYSYRILRRLTRRIAKIPAPLLPIIATKRGIERVAMWGEANFVSPLEPLTVRTAEALGAQLGEAFLVDVAYEFRRPLLTDVLPRLRERGATRYVIVPMYAGTGDFTDGITELAIEDARAAFDWLGADDLSMCLLTDTPERVEALADVMARFVLDRCAEAGIASPATDWALCLGAHGSVHTSPEGVDNGVGSFGALLWALHTRLREHFGMVRNGWLNHERGGRWTEPSVDRLLPRLRAAGYDRLVYFPFGFTTDNAESALEGKQMCLEMEDPFARVEYLPCLNDAPGLVALIAGRVAEHLSPQAPAVAV